MKKNSLNIRKISKKTLRQIIYEELKYKIIFGEILPGQVMTMQGLANEFGVSLMPVREALCQLESEKIVVIQINKSVHVNTLTLKEMEEALQLRLMFESKLVDKACDRMTVKDLTKIKRILVEMEGCLAKPEKYLNLNRQFHLAIYSRADSPMLLQFVHSLWARINPYKQKILARFGEPSLSMECHHKIYGALVAKNKLKLNEYLIEDLELANRIILANFRKLLDEKEVIGNAND